jgi:hypothetical protein
VYLHLKANHGWPIGVTLFILGEGQIALEYAESKTGLIDGQRF